MPKRLLSSLSLAAFISLIFANASCKGSGPQQPAAPSVTVSKPLAREVVDWDEYPGRLQAPQSVVVAARVSGVIVDAPFEEGATVQQGAVLFIIDDRPFSADLASREADIKKAEAQLAQADAHFKRYDQLKGTKAISAQDYDDAVAGLRQAQAGIAVAKAAADVSRLNLEWTKVTAPITGRVGRKEITVGNLVNGGAGLPSRLTTITSIDPLYCYVTVPERMVLNYRNLAGERQRTAAAQSTGTGRIPCAIQLENEKSFAHQGQIDFIDNQVDPTTGTVGVRGVIPNPGGILTPGLFAKMRVPGSEPYQTLLLPDVAIGTDQNNRFVLTVGAENTVETRPVKLGKLFGKLRSITDGLKGDELVVVNGLQQARPGTKVSPTESPVPSESVDQLLNISVERQSGAASAVPAMPAKVDSPPSPQGGPSSSAGSKP